MSGPWSRWGLRGTVTASFALGALIVCALLSVGTYLTARHYLMDQRQATALRQSYADASFVVDGLLARDARIPDVLSNVNAPVDSELVVHKDDRWYSSALARGSTDHPHRCPRRRGRRRGDVRVDHRRRPARPRRRNSPPGRRRGVLRDRLECRAARHADHARRGARRLRDPGRHGGCRPRPGGLAAADGPSRRRRDRRGAHRRRRPADPAAADRGSRPRHHRRLVQQHGRGPRRADPARRSVRGRPGPRAALPARPLSSPASRSSRAAGTRCRHAPSARSTSSRSSWTGSSRPSRTSSSSAVSTPVSAPRSSPRSTPPSWSASPSSRATATRRCSTSPVRTEGRRDTSPSASTSSSSAGPWSTSTTTPTGTPAGSGRSPSDGSATESASTSTTAGTACPEADRDRIFERFVRAGSRGSLPGSGLGLSIVAETASSLGGRVWCEDAPGGGARFSMEVPIAPRQAPSRDTGCRPRRGVVT